MAKRKSTTSKTKDDVDGNNDGNSDSSNSEASLIDVSFDFFDPNPDVDYHATRRLLGQLFGPDAELLHTHALAELALAQARVGTTVKTDGIESDPLALLSVLNMHVHKENPAIKAIAEYALHKAQSNGAQALHDELQHALSHPTHTVGLVLCERLINMPVQVVPHMYRMLKDEIAWAINENEPYAFTHLLIISRVYHLTPEEDEALSNNAPTKPPASKRARKAVKAADEAGTRPADGIYPFHPEEDTIKEFATHILNYKFTKSPPEPRNSESFGLDTRGRIILVPRDKFDELVVKLGQIYV